MKRLTMLLLVLGLAGCAISRPGAESQSFLIQPERAGAPARTAASAALRVGAVRVAPPFDTRIWVYRRDDVRFENDFYNGFAADPAAMVAEAAAGWMRRSGLFQEVLPPPVSGRTGYRLDVDVTALYVDFQARPPQAVWTLRWRLLRESDGARMLEVACDERVPLAERTPVGAARAHREALARALHKLEAALAAATL